MPIRIWFILHKLLKLCSDFVNRSHEMPLFPIKFWTILMLCGFVFISQTSSAQDSVVVTLPPIIVEATRQLETYTTSARSIYIQQHNLIDSEPGLSLQRVLRGHPGIQISERGHFALGERILIRGMGYRAAFGVRGLQAFLNGIPLTMPDGQSMLDVVDPVFIGRSELLRGPSSLFWGNASAGVLHLASLEDQSPLRLRYLVGRYGLRQYLIASRFRVGSQKIHAYASRVQKHGYRKHSKGSFIRAGLNHRIPIGTNTSVSWTLNTAIQDVLSPGSLTLEQVSLDPTQSDPRNQKVSAGKNSTHVQGGIAVHTRTRLGHLTATGYGIRRSLENPLSFAWSELDRVAAGLYAQLQIQQSNKLGFTTGIDLRQLSDHRSRFNNDAGRKGERTLLDQQEFVRSIAVFAGANLQLFSRIGLSTGLRLDQLHFKMEDHMLANGDQSGHRNFLALSPSFGLFFRMKSIVWYANFGTSFETPTTTELINSSSGSVGLNSDLDPQHTRGIEAGLRGRLDRFDLELDLAVFALRIRDRLLPQQGEDGRTWYRNGGKNHHNGAELALTWPIDSPAGARISYNYGSFLFKDAPEKNLRIPGVPSHQFHVTLYASTRSGWNAQVIFESASGMWADNANSVRSDGFAVVDVYLSHSNWDIGGIALRPFARVQNMMNHQYVRSMVVNAYGGRYFEPAEGRSIQAGIGISL